MPAIDPVLAAEAMKDLHLPVLAAIAVGAVVALLVSVVRSRRRSAARDRNDDT